MLFRLCLHLFGRVFTVRCQGLMIGASFCTLNSLAHVHWVGIDGQDAKTAKAAEDAKNRSYFIQRPASDCHGTRARTYSLKVRVTRSDETKSISSEA